MFRVWNTRLPYTKSRLGDFLLQWKRFAFCIIPRKLNQRKHTLFLFGGMFIAWNDTFQNKACHVLHAGVHCIFYICFLFFFANFTTSLSSLSSEAVYSIKSHVLWKFSFTFRSILGLLICFKQAKSRQLPKLQMRYLLLAKSVIYPPRCQHCNIEKVYEQGSVQFFSTYRWMISFQQTVHQINTANIFVIRTKEMWLCDIFSSSFYYPPYFAHRFISFELLAIFTTDLSCHFSMYTFPNCSNCMCLFFPLKLFVLNKWCVCTFCFVFLYGSCDSHAFSGNSVIRW